MQVGGCIICYSVLAGFAEKLLPDNTVLYPMFHSILEISGGSHAICESSLSLKTKFRLLSAALSFSGISILAQNHAFLSPLGISMTNLVSFAVIRAACAFVCAAILF